jgi:hypothetical protein
LGQGLDVHWLGRDIGREHADAAVVEVGDEDTALGIDGERDG